MQHFYKTLFLCFLSAALFFISTQAHGQSKIDSLLTVLKRTKENTTKSSTLNALGSELIYTNPDTSIILANQAISLSEKAKNKKHIADSYHLIGLANIIKQNYPSLLEYNFRALALREELADKPGIARSLGNIGLVYREQADYPKALDYYFKALKMDEELANKVGISKSLTNIGIIYSDQADYPKALNYYFKALKIDEELADTLGISKSLTNIGVVYHNQADYPKALDYYFKSLKMAEQVGDNNSIAVLHGNIGIVYKQQGDYLKALDYYFKALKLHEQLESKNGIAFWLGNIGNVYNVQGDNPKALDYYFKALKLHEEIGNKSGIARHLGNIGNVYTQQKDYPKALDYYFRAMNMNQELGNKDGFAVHLGNIGTIYTETGRFAEAEEYLKRAIAIVDSIGALDNERRLEESLSKLYNTTGRYKLALEHYIKSIVLKDSLFNQEKNAEITRKEMNYEFEKIQASEKAGHEKEMAVADIEIKKQTLLKNSFLGGLGLALVLFFLIYNNYRTSQKLKLETIRNNIAADLHDDIGSTLNSISLFSEVAKQEAGKSIPALDQIGISARKIIDAMSDIVWTINPENDTFENVIMRMRSLSYLLLKAKAIEFTFKADENLNRLSLSMPVRKNVYLLFKEAINNMVKYSNATQASIHLSLLANSSGKNVKMIIQDNGVGFEPETAAGEGNGIKNMRRRAAEIGAHLSIESAQGKGTTIELSLRS